MREKLLVWGASGHASVVADIVRLEGKYEIVGFLDDGNPQRAGETFCGAPVVGGQEKLDDLFRAGVRNLIMGFGNCGARLHLSELALSKGFSIATAVHPSAIVASDVRIGCGTVVAAGAVVNPGTEIGRNVIVNTRASIDHDCAIEDGVHICPGACLAGSVRVGRAAWVGIGATVTARINIGASAVVGAGAVVVRDIPERVIAYGMPARAVRKVD